MWRLDPGSHELHSKLPQRAVTKPSMVRLQRALMLAASPLPRSKCPESLGLNDPYASGTFMILKNKSGVPKLDAARMCA